MRNKISFFLTVINFCFFTNAYKNYHSIYKEPKLPDPIVRRNLPSDHIRGKYCFNYQCGSGNEMSMNWLSEDNAFYVYEWELSTGTRWPYFYTKLQFDNTGYSSASWSMTSYRGKKIGELYNGITFGNIAVTTDLTRNGEFVRKNTNDYLLDIDDRNWNGSYIKLKIASGWAWYYDHHKRKTYIQLGIHLKASTAAFEKGWIGVNIGSYFNWN